jgi:alpha-galactosidase
MQDVKTYAAWGYVKLDWCGADYSATGAANIAQTWKNAIAASGRPMILSLNAGVNQAIASWASTRVSLWRIGDDICDTWFHKKNDPGPDNVNASHCNATDRV